MKCNGIGIILYFIFLLLINTISNSLDYRNNDLIDFDDTDERINNSNPTEFKDNDAEGSSVNNHIKNVKNSKKEKQDKNIAINSEIMNLKEKNLQQTNDNDSEKKITLQNFNSLNIPNQKNSNKKEEKTTYKMTLTETKDLEDLLNKANMQIDKINILEVGNHKKEDYIQSIRSTDPKRSNNNKVMSFKSINNDIDLGKNEIDLNEFLSANDRKTSFTALDKFKKIESKEGPTTNQNSVSGSIMLNGQKYIAVCECGNSDDSNDKNQEGRAEVSTGGCDTSKLDIKIEMTGEGANIAQIKELIGNLSDLEFVKLETTSLFCLDGRNKKAGIATPGGDFGEFLLALDVYENLLLNDKKLDKETIDILFKSYLKYMKHDKFRLCTDDKAIEFIKNEIMAEGFSIENPRPQLKPDIQKLLINHETVGDLHIKLMLRYYDKYMIRKELIEYFLLCFYNLLWDKTNELQDRVELTVLSGDHMESAFVEVRTEKECQREKIAPLIPNVSKNNGLKIFVNHLDGVKVRRRQLAEFFSNRRNHSQDEVDLDKMYNRLLHHGNAYLNIFGLIAAKKFPFYTILLS